MASGLEGARVVSGRKLVLGMVGAVLLALGVYVVYRIDAERRQTERRAAEEVRRAAREAAREVDRAPERTSEREAASPSAAAPVAPHRPGP
jgi:type II secretory pathway pseudopilin PulG